MQPKPINQNENFFYYICWVNPINTKHNITIQNPHSHFTQNHSGTFTPTQNKKINKKLPCTRSPPGDFRFKLHRQTQEPIEPIKGDMRHVAHIGWPADLHSTKLPPITLARNQRFPEKGYKQCQERKLFPSPLVTVLHLTVSHRRLAIFFFAKVGRVG